MWRKREKENHRQEIVLIRLERWWQINSSYLHTPLPTETPSCDNFIFGSLIYILFGHYYLISFSFFFFFFTPSHYTRNKVHHSGGRYLVLFFLIYIYIYILIHSTYLFQTRLGEVCFYLFFFSKPKSNGADEFN